MPHTVVTFTITNKYTIALHFSTWTMLDSVYPRKPSASWTRNINCTMAFMPNTTVPIKIFPLNGCACCDCGLLMPILAKFVWINKKTIFFPVIRSWVSKWNFANFPKDVFTVFLWWYRSTEKNYQISINLYWLISV